MGFRVKRQAILLLTAALAVGGLGFVPSALTPAKAEPQYQAGQPDLSVAGTGVAASNPGTGFDFMTAMVTDTAQRVITVGNNSRTGSGETGGAILVRFTDDGQEDHTYSNQAGRLTVLPPGGGNRQLIINDAAIMADGRVVIAGHTEDSTAPNAGAKAYLARVLADGSGLDTTFGSGNGYVEYSINGVASEMDRITAIDLDQVGGIYYVGAVGAQGVVRYVTQEGFVSGPGTQANNLPTGFVAADQALAYDATNTPYVVVVGNNGALPAITKFAWNLLADGGFAHGTVPVTGGPSGTKVARGVALATSGAAAGRIAVIGSVVNGATDEDGLVVQLNSNGTVVPQATAANPRFFSSPKERLVAGAYNAIGDLTLAGITNPGLPTDGIIRRIDVNGNDDGSFGTAGPNGFDQFEGLPSGGNETVADLSMLSDGRAVVGMNSGIHHAWARFTTDGLPEQTDGSRILFTAGSLAYGMNTNGTRLVQLSPDGTQGYYPTAGVDGYMYQQRDIGGKTQIVRVPANTGGTLGQQVVVSDGNWNDSEPSVDDSGQAVVFASTQGGGASSCIYGLLSGGRQRLACGPTGNSISLSPDISPNGGWVVYASSSGIVLYDMFAQTNTVISPNTPGATYFRPRFSPVSVGDRRGNLNVIYSASDGHVYRLNNAVGSGVKSTDMLAPTANIAGGARIVADQADATSPLVYGVFNDGATNNGLWVGSSTGSAPRRLISQQVLAVQVAREFIVSNDAPGRIAPSPQYVPSGDVPLQETAPDNPPTGTGAGQQAAGLLGINLFRSPILGINLNRSPLLGINLNRSPLFGINLNRSGLLGINLFRSPTDLGGSIKVRQGIDAIDLQSLPVKTGAIGWKDRLIAAGTPATLGLAKKELFEISLGDVLRLPDPGIDFPTLAELNLEHSEFGRISVLPFLLGDTRVKDIGGIDWCGVFNVRNKREPNDPDCGSAYGVPGSPDKGKSATLLSLQLAGFKLDDMPKTPQAGGGQNNNDLRAITVGQAPLNKANGVLANIVLSDATDLGRASIGAIKISDLPNPNAVLDCSDNYCAANPTKTLSAAQNEHKIRNADGNYAVVADLGSALAPYRLNELALAMWNGDAEDDPFDQTPENLGIVGRIDNAGGTRTVKYNVRYTRIATGLGSTSDPQLLMTLPSGWTFPTSGSYASFSGGTAGGPNALGQPNRSTNETGHTVLAWDIPTDVNLNQVLTIDVELVPGLELEDGAGVTVEFKTEFEQFYTPNQAAVDVRDELNDSVLQPDRLYVGHLSESISGLGVRTSHPATYRVPAPAPGSRLNVYLGGLKYDADLVVYHPQSAVSPTSPLRTTTVAGPDDVIPEQPIKIGGDGEPLTIDGENDVPLLANRAVAGVAAKRSAKDNEQVSVITWNSPANSYYTLQVSHPISGHETRSFNIRYTVDPPPSAPAGPARTTYSHNAPFGSQVTAPAAPNTLILTAPSRLRDAYDATKAAEAHTALNELATATNGVVFPVDSVQAVRDAFTALDNNPAKPELSNGVVREINAAVDTYLGSKRNSIKNVIVVGSDEIIPMARIPDLTQIANEQTFAQDLKKAAESHGGNDALYGAALNAMILSDDPYGSWTPRSFLGAWLYVPNVAIGRLVETPEHIIAAVNSFIHGGQPGDAAGVVRPTRTLSVGHDFMTRMSNDIATSFAAQFPEATNQSLIGETWVRSNLESRLGQGAAVPDVISINVHYSPEALSPAKRWDPANPSEPDLPAVDAVTNRDFQRRLLMTMGCHSGFNIMNYLAGAASADWPEALAGDNIAAYVANTGFGIGVSGGVNAFSSKLFLEFAKKVSQYPFGEALQRAKQEYLAHGVTNVYDYKILAEATFFGIPNYKVFGATPPASPPAGQTPTNDANFGGQIKSASVTTSTPVGSNWRRNATPDGDYWTMNGADQAFANYRVPQPQINREITPASGELARGVFISAMKTADDESNFNPYLIRPTVNERAAREPQFSEILFPEHLVDLHTYNDGTATRQRLTVVPAQFRSTGEDDAGKTIGRERRFESITTQVLFSSFNDSIKPVYTEVAAPVANGTASFRAAVTDAAGLVRVYVLYRSGTDGTWTGKEMTLSNGMYRATGAVSGGEVEYLIQAVDLGGNVATTTGGSSLDVVDDEGSAPQPSAPEPPPSATVPDDALAAELLGTPTNGWYQTSAQVRITNSNSGNPVLVKIDNGAEQSLASPATVSVSGDGLHTVHYRSATAASQQISVPIDANVPTVTINTPPSGTPTYGVGQAVNADYFCTDTALVSCVGNIANGTPLDTATETPGTSTRTLTVTATDASGRTASISRPYKVKAGEALSAVVNGGTLTNGWYGTAVTVHLSSGNGNAITAKLDGGPDIVFPDGEGDIPVNTSGNHTVTYQTATATGTPLSVPVDLDPPVVTVATPPAGIPTYDLNQVVPANYGCTDISPTSCVGSIANGANLDTATPTATGATRSVSVTATDSQNRVVTVTREYKVRAAEGVSAVVTSGTLHASGWYQTAANVHVSSGNGTSISAQLDNGAVQTFPTGEGDILVNTGGDHTITYFTATSGNRTLNVKVDLDVPTVSIVTPPTGIPQYSTGQVVNAAYTCADISPTTCVGTVANGAPIDTSTPTNGTPRTFTVTATDSVGRAVSDTRQYTVAAAADTLTPVVSGTKVTVSGVDYYTSNPTDVTITSSAGNAITVKVDGGAPQTLPSPAVVHLTAEGSRLVEYSNNQGQSGTLAVKIDLNPPTINIVTPPASAATYVLDQVVNADYSCSDLMTPVTSCTGTVPTGSALNTATWTGPGESKNFIVTSTDSTDHTAASPVRNYKVQFADGTPCEGSTSHRLINLPNVTTVSVGSPKQLAITFRVCNAAGVSIGTPRLAGVAAPRDTKFTKAKARGGCAPATSTTPRVLCPSSNPRDTKFKWSAKYRYWQFRHDTTGLKRGTHIFRVTLPDNTYMDYTIIVK